MKYQSTEYIWLTGGLLSLNTSLDFLKQLDGAKYNRFMYPSPSALTLSPTDFKDKQYPKWNRRRAGALCQAKAKFVARPNRWHA